MVAHDRKAGTAGRVDVEAAIRPYRLLMWQGRWVEDDLDIDAELGSLHEILYHARDLKMEFGDRHAGRKHVDECLCHPQGIYLVVVASLGTHLMHSRDLKAVTMAVSADCEEARRCSVHLHVHADSVYGRRLEVYCQWLGVAQRAVVTRDYLISCS